MLLGGRLLSGDEGPAVWMFSPTGERLTLHCTRAGADRETTFAMSQRQRRLYWSDKDVGMPWRAGGRERLLRIARKTRAMEAPAKPGR